ncbi:MAG: hypothetical protein IPO92_22805 [Saprospiraceae bacterium]|nr:hypothetical protein [Saprospiraceae bacterium]
MKRLSVLAPPTVLKNESNFFGNFSYTDLFKVCLVLFIFATVLTFKSCGKTAGNTCGPETTYHNPNYKVKHNNCSDGIAYRDHYYEDVTGTPEDICTDEHINTEFAVILNDIRLSEIVSIKAKVYWGGFLKK